MKRRQANKIFARLSRDFRLVKKYKQSTAALAVSKSLGMYCPPRDVFVICGLAQLIAEGRLDLSLARQSNIELAS